MKDFWAEELQNQRKGKIGKTILLVVILLIIIAIIINENFTIFFVFNLKL